MPTKFLRLAAPFALFFAALPAARAAEILANGGIETQANGNAAGWTRNGLTAGLAVATTNQSPHSGTWALRVTGRGNPLDGPKQNITAALIAGGNGTRYVTWAWVKVDDFASVRLLVRRGDDHGQQPDLLLAERVILTAGQWTLVEGSATVPWTGTLTSANLLVEVFQLSRTSGTQPASLVPNYTIDDFAMDVDADADGIMDRDEAALGFSSTSADTDDDGLPDHWEHAHAFSPALDEAALDPDGDGFTNREEFFAATDPRDATSKPGVTSDPSASAKTRGVLRYLALLPAQAPDRHVLVGQAVTDMSSPTEYPHMMDDLATVTGHHAAIFSVGLESTGPLQLAQVEPAVLAYWQSGGLVLCKWAVWNPWTSASMGDQTNVDIPGLLDPASSAPGMQVQNQAARDNLLGWMSAVADMFARLEAQGVVVMFRPMSEMNGPWFWWGHRERSEYVGLWRFFHDYFTNTRGSHNLIWVYESDSSMHVANVAGATGSASDYYYPGDDLVDVIGHNLYHDTWVLPFDANEIYARYPKAYGIPQAGPAHTQRDGTFSNLVYVNRTEAALPRSSFFIPWNSFTNQGYQHIGIIDNADAVELMNHPAIVTREGLPAELFVTPAAPTISTPPASLTAQRAGADVTLTVIASGTGPFTYQWLKNGAPVTGANAATLTLAAARSAASGSYTVQVTNATGTTTSTASIVRIVEPGLVNLSVRAVAGSGDETLIVGYVTEDATDKTVLVRAVGPGLEPFNVVGFLPAPAVTLFDGPASLVANIGWTSAANANDVRATTAALNTFALDEAGTDSALLVKLPGGAYTVQVGDTAGRSGVVLVEAYDASTNATEVARLHNLSARGFVGTNDNLMIGGVVIGGTTSRRLLIRAVGPTLAGFDVAGVLADPQCDIKSGNTTVMSFDNWSAEATADETRTAILATGAFPLDESSLDAARVVTLAPGAYTVLVRGTAGTTGIALLEIYDLED